MVVRYNQAACPLLERTSSMRAELGYHRRETRTLPDHAVSALMLLIDTESDQVLSAADQVVNPRR